MAARGTVIVTRPRPSADRLAARLDAMGYTTVVSPMLDIVPLEEGAATLRQWQAPFPHAVVLTSAHAVSALADGSLPRDIPVFCVGYKTMQAANHAGFGHAIEAGPTARDICQWIAAVCSSADGAILYPSARHVAFDMVAALGEKGFQVIRVPVYQAVKAVALTDDAADALKTRHGVAVMFFSRRTAETFTALAGAALTSADALCLSQKVAEGLNRQAWRSVKVSTAPTEDALLMLLETQAAA